MIPSAVWYLLPLRPFFTLENRKNQLVRGQVKKVAGWSPRRRESSWRASQYDLIHKTVKHSSRRSPTSQNLHEESGELPFNLKVIRRSLATRTGTLLTVTGLRAVRDRPLLRSPSRCSRPLNLSDPSNMSGRYSYYSHKQFEVFRAFLYLLSRFWSKTWCLLDDKK